ncbi:MAG: hypothetical protein JJ877_15335 [Thalassococcus sp.]|uniref:LPS assembly lipoprotein LptE n=1 Tax=Thalassococcus sp. TaxID=1928858 RepID=UPI001B2AC7D5|nr:LPS assembly lipoprotein LptE [Thalassococcus sp.]MBO6868414.1 hypothetical protein [Thalassococcus sp.]
MWSYNRRILLVSALALAGCGFTPAYGPQGSGSALLGTIALEEPADRNEYILNRRLEERLGRATSPRYSLKTVLTTGENALGSTSTGSNNRSNLDAKVSYDLIDQTTGQSVHSHVVSGFVGYSTSGSNVSTFASQRDAMERLMTILADQIVDQLTLIEPDQLP